jgi:hypothetical protein
MFRRNEAAIMLCLIAAVATSCATSDEVALVPQPCDDAEARSSELEGWFDALTEGVGSRPADVVLPEETNGTLRLGLSEASLPYLTSPDGVFAAASPMGEGRVVALSGQDFLSFSDRSTLLDQSSI